MKNKVLDLCETYPKHEGSKIVELLVKHPGESFSSLVIEISLGQKIDPITAGLNIHIPHSLELADYRAINEVKKRLNKLIEIKASMSVDGIYDTYDDDDEIRQLQNYLKQCISPRGKQRKFKDEAKRAYDRQNIAVRRFLERIRRDGYHVEAEIIRQNLKLGLSSCYKGER